MKKKLLLPIFFAFIAFIWWAIEDILHECRIRLEQYGVEVTHCSFVYPYIKFKVLRYNDWHAYDVNVNIAKVFSLGSLSIKKLVYKRSNSEIDLGENDFIFNDIKKILSILQKYFQDHYNSVMFPKSILIKHFAINDKVIKNLEIHNIDHKNIDAYGELEYGDVKIFGEDVIRDKVSFQIKISKDLSTKIIVKSAGNILHLFGSVRTIADNEVKFLGSLQYNLYGNIDYDLDFNFSGRFLNVVLDSKYGHLETKAFFSNTKLLEGCYTNKSYAHPVYYEVYTQSSIPNSSSSAISYIKSFEDSKLFMYFGETELFVGINTLNRLFNVNFKNSNNGNIKLLLNNEKISIFADIFDTKVKFTGNLDFEKNLVSSDDVLAEYKGEKLKFFDVTLRYVDDSVIFKSSKVSMGSDNSKSFSLDLSVDNSLKVAAKLHTDRFKYHNYLIKGGLDLFYSNDNLFLKADLKSDNGFSLKVYGEDTLKLDFAFKNNTLSFFMPQSLSLKDLNKDFSPKNYTLNAEIDLKDFGSIISSGIGKVDLECKDSKVSGKIVVNNLNILDYVHGVILKDINLLFKGLDGVLQCCDSTIKDLKGSKANFSGVIKIQNLLDWNIAIMLPIKNFCLVNGASLKLYGSGPLYVNGSFQRGLDITGDIVTDKADFNLLDLTPDYKKVVFRPIGKRFISTSTDSQLKDKIRFNITLKSDNLLIHNRTIYVPLHGKLYLVGNGKTSLKGKMSVIGDAYIMMFKKKLGVINGEVIFLEEYPFDAFFVLNASSEIEGVNLKIDIKKTVGDFEYKFYSVPYMTEDRLLAKILFNKDVEDLTPLDWVQIAYIVKSVDENSIFSDIDDVTQKIGIDELKIEQDGVNDSGTLKIGKNFKQGLSLSVENDMSTNVQKLRLIKKLNKLFSVDVSTNGEVGVVYKYKY